MPSTLYYLMFHWKYHSSLILIAQYQIVSFNNSFLAAWNFHLTPFICICWQNYKFTQSHIHPLPPNHISQLPQWLVWLCEFDTFLVNFDSGPSFSALMNLCVCHPDTASPFPHPLTWDIWGRKLISRRLTAWGMRLLRSWQRRTPSRKAWAKSQTWAPSEVTLWLGGNTRHWMSHWAHCFHSSISRHPQVASLAAGRAAFHYLPRSWERQWEATSFLFCNWHQTTTTRARVGAGELPHPTPEKEGLKRRKMSSVLPPWRALQQGFLQENLPFPYISGVQGLFFLIAASYKCWVDNCWDTTWRDMLPADS